MRAPPLGPSVELAMGPRSAVLVGADACELRHWGLRRNSPWGHGAPYWVGRAHVNVAAAGAF
eukprot:5903545-Pyramimonas_sp.AAC.1